MKIILLFDCHTFDMEPQGTSTFLAGLLNALPVVLARDFPGTDVELHCAALSAEKVSEYINVPYVFHSIETKFAIRNLFEIPRVAKKINASVVVSQYVRPIWVPNYSASIIHDLLFTDFPGQFSVGYRFSREILFLLSAKFSSKVFTVSEYSRSRIAHLYDICAKDIGVLPNAIGSVVSKQPRATGLVSKNKSVRLLYVSRLEQRKRHDWCLKAVEDLIQEGQDVHLTIIGGGGGAYATILRNLFAEFSKKHNGKLIHLEGVSRETLQREFAFADIFLFPSLGEGFGIPVIEAAAEGVPCVVADGSALSELQEFYAGESFKSTDYSDFLQSIRKVIGSLNMYKATASRNIDKVRAHFSWEVSAQRFLEWVLSLDGLGVNGTRDCKKR